MKSFQPLIVVVAYNRPEALNRLLCSLSGIETDLTPKLLISIDNGGKPSDEVEEIARAFDWRWEKEVIRHNDNLGLKNHILWCAGKSVTHGSVVILEDDLLVSPGFYSRAVQLLNAYQNEERIAGISLYTYTYNESANLPFEPIKSKGDVHLMQQVSSWGQAWTEDQWKRFIQWQTPQFDRPLLQSLPQNIQSWPDSSWKKHFINYVVSNELFVLYPNRSLTSNCGDAGTHFIKKYNLFRSALDLGSDPLITPEFNKIDIRYDINHELMPKVFKERNDLLKNFDFQVDIYGTGSIAAKKSPYVLTTRTCSKSEFSFGDELYPLELNVLLGIKGDAIRLARREDVEDIPSDRLDRYKRNDRTPKWVHDSLGTPLKDRIDRLLGSLTGIALIDRTIQAVARFIVKLRIR